MLNEALALSRGLPSWSSHIASLVHGATSGWQLSAENRASLALSAGVRDAVENDLDFFMWSVSAAHEFIPLLGYADASTRRTLGAWMAQHPEWVRSLGMGGNTRHGRIAAIFRHAQKNTL